MGKKKKSNLLTLDDAVILALRCEYFRIKGRKPGKEHLFWRFAAEYIATVFHSIEDDGFYDALHTVFDANINLMAAHYPEEFAAIQKDEELVDIYLSSYDDE